MSDTINMVLIYGSVRDGRYCDTVAKWAHAQVAAHKGFSIKIVDPAELNLPIKMSRNESGDLDKLKRLIDAADAFLIVTPEYNHGYPAALKHLIDSVYSEWQAKPVAFVSYGAASGGLRAVEQLRQVFAELHIASMRSTVSFANVWEQFDEHGRLHAPDRPEKAMSMMLAQLQWWASALKNARAQIPYDAVAN